MQSIPTDWSELSNGLLQHLTSLLIKLTRLLSIQCRLPKLVCSGPTKSSPSSAITVVGSRGDKVTHKQEFFSLAENKHYFIDISELRGQRICSSSYGRLFTMDTELNIGMLNPLTRECYDLPLLPSYNNYLNFKYYVKKHESDGDVTCEAMQFTLVHKVILDRDPSHNSDFKVLIIYGVVGNLACWRSGESAWTWLGRDHSFTTNYNPDRLSCNEDSFTTNYNPDRSIVNFGFTIWMNPNPW